MTETQINVENTEEKESVTECKEVSAADQAIIDSLEEMYKERFSENDEEYMKFQKTPLAPPPLVQNWYTRPKRSYDWTRERDGNRGGHRSSGRPYYAGSRQQDNYGKGHYNDQRGNNYHDRRQQHRGGGHRQDNRSHPYQNDRHGNRQYGHQNWRDRNVHQPPH